MHHASQSVYASVVGDGNGNSLRIAMTDADIDGLDARGFGSCGGITMKLERTKKGQRRIGRIRQTQLGKGRTMTVGLPVRSLMISISRRGAPAPLLLTPRALKTASFADHRPAKLACVDAALPQ